MRDVFDCEPMHGGCHYPVCASPDHGEHVCRVGRLRADWEHIQMDEERHNDAIALGIAPPPRSLPPAISKFGWGKLPLPLRQRFWQQTSYLKASPSFELIVSIHEAIRARELNDAVPKSREGIQELPQAGAGRGV